MACDHGIQLCVVLLIVVPHLVTGYGRKYEYYWPKDETFLIGTGPITNQTVERCSDATKARCHPNAQCLNHPTGTCCACVPPMYGNGYTCLEIGIPQKVNGRVYGSLNGVQFNGNRMHTYVVTHDGRTYTAISRVPKNLGNSMTSLSSVGAIIGWLFARTDMPRAKNGYYYTGGKFNVSTLVTFKQRDGPDQTVRINQVFRGHIASDEIEMDTTLEGNVPMVPDGATVSVNDYIENYHKAALGIIKSFSERRYMVNNATHRYDWDTTITFDECRHNPSRHANDVMRLAVGRHHVLYQEDLSAVRYAMSSRVRVFSGDDPCANAAQICGQNAECKPEGNSYRCECKRGYTGDGQYCRDRDECRHSPCDENARCYNTPGAFECRCMPGFAGDGRTCTRDERRCGNAVCDTNARCVYNSVTRQPTCECSTGFQGDGSTCSAITVSCNEADICGDNAQCVYDEDLREYVCECMDEFSGDGYSCEPVDNGCGQCDRYAQCVYDSYRGAYGCQCGAGYTGDGRTCSLIGTCAGCDRYARCVFNDDANSYECVCVRGFMGDGKTCERRDCREDPTMCHPEGGICWLDPSRDIGICRCNYGFRGDGFNCQPIGCDEYNDCDDNAKCVNDGFQYRCQCNDGFEGDGRRCRAKTTGCNVYNDCASNARCVPSSEDPTRYECRCNPGFQGDGKVCIQRVVPCNQVNNCDRNAECVYDPDLLSYKCRCARGYEGDGLSCNEKEIVDCRRNPRMCAPDALCVQGATEAYVCVCKPGFRGDGASCSPVVREGNYLIYAQGNKVMRVSSDRRQGDYGRQIAYVPGMLAVGVDTDCQEGSLYWTDASKGMIRRAKLDGSDMEEIVKGLKSPEGVAVDFVARNMFFTDSELDTLQVSKLDGSSVKTLADTDMTNPRAVVLDINRGVVYWTDWNRSKPQIERIGMDGEGRKVLVSDGLRLPNGLAFDSFSQTLCWGDAGTQTIECVRSDGAGRRVVFDKATYPFDIALMNNVVYWTDWKRRDIPNVNQNGGDMNVALNLAIGGHGRTYGITAVKDQCPPARNSCGLNNGGCKFLCLPTDNGGRTCACPDGIDPRICLQ